jgi:hypothetical protein
MSVPAERAQVNGPYASGRGLFRASGSHVGRLGAGSVPDSAWLIDLATAAIATVPLGALIGLPGNPGSHN